MLRSWYLVQCKPRQDGRAEENLVRQGYVCARPKCRHERIVHGQLQVKIESLFPGYLFIQMSEESNWASLRSTRGVSHVVSFGGRPLPVSEELVGELQRRSEIEITSGYKIGDNVRIVSGSFAALDAIFLERDGRDRAILLITILSSLQKISVPFKNISVG